LLIALVCWFVEDADVTVFCYPLQICLSSELEAMAKIVQDLESQLAVAQEENTGLTRSLEVLDEQHQSAIGL
jgi:hypothetical protein